MRLNKCNVCLNSLINDNKVCNECLLKTKMCCKCKNTYKSHNNKSRYCDKCLIKIRKIRKRRKKCLC